MKLTAIIEREENGYFSLCPELDIASQRDTIQQARDNLQEAIELFFECASTNEMKERFRSEVYITHVEVATGEAAVLGCGTFRQRRLRDREKRGLARFGERKPRGHAEAITERLHDYPALRGRAVTARSSSTDIHSMPG